MIDFERPLAQNLCSKRTESVALSLQKQAKHSQAQPSIAKHSQAQPSTASTALHSPVQPCRALVIFSLSLWPPASLARPSLSFRFLFEPLGLLLGQFLPLLGPSWVTFCRSWSSLGRSWALLGGSWEALGGSWAALGRSWGDLGTTCKNH